MTTIFTGKQIGIIAEYVEAALKNHPAEEIDENAPGELKKTKILR